MPPPGWRQEAMLRAATLVKECLDAEIRMDCAASRVSDWITLILGRAGAVDDEFDPACGFVLRSGTDFGSYWISFTSAAPFFARSLDFRICGIKTLIVSLPSFARALLFRNGADE